MSMKAIVEDIAGRFVLEAPGISALHIEHAAHDEARQVVITCPACRARTAWYLVAGDEFEIAHKRRCRLQRAIAHVISHHPERVGAAYGVVALAPGTRWTPPPPPASES